MKKANPSKYEEIMNKGTLNVIVFACFIIIIAILITGISSYSLVKKTMIEKLQTQDLVYILKSISAQIDGRIDKAKETSLVLADNPSVIKWFENGETDKQYEKLFIQQMTGVAETLHYTSVFFANKKTGHYWTNAKLLTYTLSKDDSKDSWFYDAISSAQKIALNINYDKGLKQTNLWINTLMGDINNPAGVAGVGVDFQDISKEFGNYKIGNKSNLWLVDAKGKISISGDVEQSGGTLSDYLPTDVYNNIIRDTTKSLASPSVISYTDKNGQVDLVSQKLKSCDWILVFQTNRSETLAMLHSLMTSTVLTIIVVVVFLLIIFYLVSSRIASPYKKAIQLNQELEREIEERTAEIIDKNKKIMESIHYAKTIQESLLPSTNVLKRVFVDNFVLWKPRDIVGGDFYWLKETEHGFVLVVGDCTGHGIPGALMTMAVNSILSNIMMKNDVGSPSLIIKELNGQLREALHKDQGNYSTDDGLDAAICCYDKKGKLYFAGAKLGMYVSSAGQVNSYEGYKSGIGYIKSAFLSDFADVEINVNPGDRFYFTTDGFVDQNGGINDYSFGKSQFREIIANFSSIPMHEQSARYALVLNTYMGLEAQRDDITVFGFELM